MESDDSIPSFDCLNDALMSGGPFRLTTNVLRRGAYEFTLDKVPEDKRGLLHNALLNFGRIKWTITNEEDIQFLSTLIKENQQIDMLYLRISTTIDISQLAGAIERSNIGDVELDRDCESDISPLLKALGKVARLKKFTLWYSIFPQEYEALACAIRNEHLEEVYISMSPFPPAAVWTSLTPVISAHTTLKRLHLPWSYGGAEGLKAITEILSKNRSIQDLSFDDHLYVTTSAYDTKMLCDALKSNLTLTSLSASCFETAQTQALFEVFAHHQVRLSTLKLNQAILNNETLRVMSESLSANTTLTSLAFPDSILSDDTCQTLCRILKSNNTIKQLDLHCCQYEEGGIKAICELVSNDRLQVLILRDSTTTSPFDEHCKEIAHMLRSNQSLTVLDLSTNQFTDQGLNYIFEAMVHNTTLKKLMTSSHYQDTFFSSNLTAMLAHNKTLRHLQVSVDPSVKESRDFLCEGLAQNDSLTHLDIAFKSNNDKSNEPQLLVQSLVDVLQDNYAVTTVAIRQNVNVRQIERILQRNRQFKSDLRFKVAVLSHNIARSSHALTILPREIWKQILKSITSPGMEPFDDLVNRPFKSYE